jgi:hypothetical protein
MPTYALIVTDPRGRRTTTLSDWPDDATAIADVGRFVSAEHPSVAVARSADGELDWLGTWDFDSQARWQAKE